MDVEISVGCRGVTVGFAAGFGLITLWCHVFRPALPAALVNPPGDRPTATPPQQRVGRRRRFRRIRRSADETAASGSLPPPPPLVEVAACVGGLLDLDIIAQAESVRLGVIAPLRADVFVAGTLNATVAEAADQASPRWKRRVSLALEHLAALEPHLKTAQVERQLSAAELLSLLQNSGFGAAYARQVSGAGAGRLRPTDDDPRLWLPTMLAPALGNPSGNTLREFHYQSRCMAMIEVEEGRRRAEYARILFTRLEMLWLHPHPPLSLLDASLVWVPAGEDNGGVNDRHWLSGRKTASVLMRRWDSLLDGSALAAVHGSSAVDHHAGAQPRFVSSEMFLREFAR